VYAAEVDGQPLTFHVFGVWRKNMVMCDTQTGTIWQHATGEAIDGLLKSKQLNMLAGWETIWGVLHKAYPNACYALEPKKFTGLIPKAVLQRMLGITNWANLNGLSSFDNRLRPHDVIIGIVANGAAKAYLLDTLRTCHTVVDQFGGETIQIVYDETGDQVTVATEDGTRLKHVRQWWSGWSEFHPRSEIYGEKSDAHIT
jgi:hypothetical protein